MGNLNIIKASAGSGKTYTLTQEYLKLLGKREGLFRNILAVTFTNKATEEMKQRIIETLFAQSGQQESSKSLLAQILNDYSSFSVSTIDSFLQRVLRAFAQDVGLNSSYEVELDQELALSQSVDSMISSLDRLENRELLELLTSFGIDSIGMGGGWDIFRSITKLGNELFKESYKELSISIADKGEKEIVDKLIKTLKVTLEQFPKKLERCSGKFFNLLEEHSIDIHYFKGKSRTPLALFKKLGAGEVVPLSNSFKELASSVTPLDYLVSKSVAKSDPPLFNSIENFWYGGGQEIVEELVDLYDSGWSGYITAGLVFSNLHQTRVLGYIEKFLKSYLKERNLVLIPDSTLLLNKIIGDSDAPFLYEKVGSRYDHFLLDEFQDTSPMQWQNFKPLILEGLSRGKSSLVVGDVKQSIYRWRNSDWTLLSNGIYNDIPKERIAESQLRENWRSSETIIEFNNRFFPYLGKSFASLLGEEDSSIYSEAEQKISPLKREGKGRVKVHFVEKKKGEESWEDRALAIAVEQVLEWRSNGWNYSDIAFLVRSNLQGEWVVNALLEAGFPVLSNDSLYISSSPAVNLIISILKHISNPEDQLNNTLLNLLEIDLKKLHHLSNLPLYRMCEQIIALFFKEIKENDTIYLTAFLNLVLQYGRGERGDIYSFLLWWESSGIKKSIATPEGVDAIRVMTIHKAKGLGIPLVLLPFMELPMDHQGNRGPILWCRSNIEPYSNSPLLAIKYSKRMEESLFKEEYLLERKKSYMDNLNLAYVAMTRGEQEMVILSPLPPKSGESHSIAKSLYTLLEGELIDNCYIVGEPIVHSDRSQKVQGPAEGPPLKFGESEAKIVLALRGEEYFNERSARGMGLIMHHIMEHIDREEDLQKALESALSKGILPLKLKMEAEEKILGMFKSVRERGWFSDKYSSLREVKILLEDGSIKRPDRVLLSKEEVIVIDYKFGAKRLKHHLDSVNEYCSIIGKMEHNNSRKISGFIWYPDNNEILESSFKDR
ncbi:MAG: UvrD-helicase domain-containing protein [Bacteroidales bacterium]